MLLGKHITVVLPAYNAELTLQRTYIEIPHELVDRVILVDDHSSDNTVAVAKRLGIREVVSHQQNRGYGGNQKTCYRRALELGTDVVVMLHPDYQYSPKLLTSIAAMIASGHYDIALGSRIISEGALKGGMPIYKYLANRFLTMFQNMCLGLKLSEYHTGYRAFSAEVLKTLTLESNSEDFIFDNEFLVEAHARHFRIGELSCPARYFAEASSIALGPSTRYGLGVMKLSVEYLLHRLHLKPLALLEGETLFADSAMTGDDRLENVVNL